MAEIVEELWKFPLFEGLSLAEAQAFSAAVGGHFQVYERESRILNAYEDRTEIGILAAGKAQVVTENWLGDEVLGHYLLPGSIFGCPAAILGGVYNNASVDAKTEVTVFLLPYQELLTRGIHQGRVHGIVMKNLLRLLAKKNVLMTRKLELLSQKSVRGRLVAYLLQEKEQQKRERLEVPGRVQLAHYLECNRSALTREVSRMEQEGLLECGEGWMRLLKKF